MLKPYEQRSRLKLTATIITIIVIAGMVVLADHLKASTPSSASVAQDTPSTAAQAPAMSTTGSNPTGTISSGTSSTSTSVSTSGYKDGTYSATSNYGVPHGEEEIKVSLTLSGGTVTSASVQNSENDFDSASYQEEFTAEYKHYVVGKKIAGLRLGIIAGASDTTVGFNEALSKIASKAQA